MWTLNGFGLKIQRETEGHIKVKLFSQHIVLLPFHVLLCGNDECT